LPPPARRLDHNSCRRSRTTASRRTADAVVGFLDAHVPGLPAGQPRRRTVLQRMWLPARRGCTSPPRGAQGRHGVVRRPRGVHGARRADGSRGRAAAPAAVPRPLESSACARWSTRSPRSAERAPERATYSSTWPRTQVTVPPPTQIVPSGPLETCTRPERPSAVPWLAT